MLGFLGHPALRHATPNIDRLAEEGTAFPEAYCSHPICCPSRANMWSGRYTQHCESWNNHKGLELGMWNLLTHLPATHEVRTVGKLDFLSGSHSVMNRVADWLACSGIEKPVFDKDISQGFSVTDDDVFRCHEFDWKLVDEAVEFLEDHTARQAAEGDRPFFLTISPKLVHAAFRTNRYWIEHIPTEDVDVPLMDPTDHPCVRYRRIAKAWRHGFDDETVRRVRRIYFAMCAEADAMVGAVFSAMKRLGLDQDTYFVFSSDHGEMALEHQDWYKMSLHEGAVRVPMIVTGPGIPAGRRMGNLVSLIDLCPTFLEMAGLPIRPGLDGESLLPLLKGETQTTRNSAYACYMGIALNTTAYMLRKGGWKYVINVGYPPQLFDLESDPGELNNLAVHEIEIVRSLDTELRSVVDYEQTHRDVMVYNKQSFIQWRRQARRGLYLDASYGLRGRPASDYWTLMDNVFTGYNGDDEEKVDQWLRE